MTRRANLHLQAGAIIRNELSQRRCRSLLPWQKTRGEDKNWKNHRDRVRNLRLLCVPPSAQKRFPEERETRVREREREETEGGGKPLGLIVGTGELEDTRGLYPAYPLSTPRTSIAMIPSPFLVISRAIVVALFIMAPRYSSGGRNEPLAPSRKQ